MCGFVNNILQCLKQYGNILNLLLAGCMAAGRQTFTLLVTYITFDKSTFLDFVHRHRL
jgi:hypothetical protein